MLRSCRRVAQYAPDWYGTSHARKGMTDWCDSPSLSEKPRNHSALPNMTRLELKYKAPKISHSQGMRIVFRIRKRERKSEGGSEHPALETWKKFKTSILRHPHTYTTKSRVEAARHLSVLENKANWKPPVSFNMMKILEKLDTFGKSCKYTPERPDITYIGKTMNQTISK